MARAINAATLAGHLGGVDIIPGLINTMVMSTLWLIPDNPCSSGQENDPPNEKMFHFIQQPSENARTSLWKRKGSRDWLEFKGKVEVYFVGRVWKLEYRGSIIVTGNNLSPFYPSTCNVYCDDEEKWWDISLPFLGRTPVGPGGH